MLLLPFFLLLVTSLGIAAAADSPSPKSPNVIVIISDDQGWPDLGCMGIKPMETPTLDKLAAEGVRATHFYVAWSGCTVSRAALLTGRYPYRNGIIHGIRNDLVNYGHHYTMDEYEFSPEMLLGLDTKEKTMGDYLKGSGYTNAVVGKWDMGQARRFLPLQRGFDQFYGHGNNNTDYYTHERYGVPSFFRDNERTEEDKGTYATDVFEREALSFVTANAGKRPFFLYLGFNAPHGASTFPEDNGGVKPGVQAPEEVVARFRDKAKSEDHAHYYAATYCMDQSIGRILDTLDKVGETNNTLIIFLSDNGGTSYGGGNAPLRGGKSTLWEGGVRVPFIARWPGKIPAGVVTDEFITSLDILPTILAATGTAAPKNITLDGYDMLPTLRGETPSPRTEMFWWSGNRKAARVRQYKWIDDKGRKESTGLYDLDADPAEKHDISKDQPEIFKKVTARFAEWQKEMEATEDRGPFRNF